MKKVLFVSGLLVSIICLLFGSCIKNDIPYPRIQVNFLTITAAGQDRGAQIDSVTRQVTFYFPEEVNIYKVKIEDYKLTPGGEVIGDVLSTPLDLSSPLTVTLSLYQEYEWILRAEQPIERYFVIENQIGQSVIDVPSRRVIASVSDKIPLDKIKVKSLKLGPVGALMTPEIEGETVDFTKPVVIAVTAFEHTERWTIYVQQVAATVTTESADAWTSVAWVSGNAMAGKDNGVEYRFADGGDNPWIKVPKENITFDGGAFTAMINHLTPQTKYEARAYSGDEYGEIKSFTTGQALQVPNMNFDNWWLNGKVWNPWPENGEQYWDTGNQGAATLGTSNSTPTDETVSGSGWAARLETRFVGIGAIGKLAAGNIFVGRYVRTDGTNGILSFGREFKERPTKLRGYFKYKCAPISSTTAGFNDLKGRPDSCIIWCALIDQPEPFEIRTNPNNRQLFDPQASTVIAYGKIECGEDVNTYTPFEFKLEYKAVNRIPKYIIITGSASKYGDYFTGGNGSVLYLDDLELLYDY